MLGWLWSLRVKPTTIGVGLASSPVRRPDASVRRRTAGNPESFPNPKPLVHRLRQRLRKGAGSD
jgi:hypothetical protein